MRRILHSFCVLLALSECGGAAERPAPDPFQVAPVCTSNERWNVALAPDSEMFPGRACVQCHADDNSATGGDAPLFAFAGTVFPSGHEPDDCRASAAENALIEVTGADGRVFLARVNDWGNFHYDTSRLRLPYTARVIFRGRVRAMLEPQMHGDCNLCHTQNGAALAPGRILLP